MQHVSPITSFEALATAFITLNRTLAGVDGLVLLSEIDRLNRKGFQPDLELLRRIIGEPKTKVWMRLHDIEGQGLVRTRYSRRAQRPVITITQAGRQALTSAAQELARGDGDDQSDHPPAIASTNRQISPVPPHTSPPESIDAVRQRRRLTAFR